MFERNVQGHLTHAARKQKRQPRSLKRNNHGINTKISLTHVVMVCDDHEVQKKLPQVLLVREQYLSEAQGRLLQRELHDNVIVIRAKRAWVNEKIMKEIIIQVRVALFEFRATHEFLLFVDAFKGHTATGVWQTAHRGGIHYCVIPASLTSMLQPCDTHVLAVYKRILTLLWFQRVSFRGRLAFSVAEVIRCINAVIPRCLESRDWSHSFRSVGLVGNQHMVSWRTISKLGLDEPIQAGRALPSLLQLISVFPRGQVLPIEDMFSLYV